MSLWSDMNVAQRNHFVGELMKAEPLSQCYLAVDGRRVLATPYAEDQRGKVDAMLIAIRASDDLWADFLRQRSDATPEWREKLTVDIERWHIRYSDTPGGAWEVVTYLQQQRCGVSIELEPDVHLSVTLTGYTADGGVVFVSAPSFEDGICQLLLKIKAPEALK